MAIAMTTNQVWPSFLSPPSTHKGLTQLYICLFKQKYDGSSHSTYETRIRSRNVMANASFPGIKCMCNPF